MPTARLSLGERRVCVAHGARQGRGLSRRPPEERWWREHAAIEARRVEVWCCSEPMTPPADRSRRGRLPLYYLRLQSRRSWPRRNSLRSLISAQQHHRSHCLRQQRCRPYRSGTGASRRPLCWLRRSSRRLVRQASPVGLGCAASPCVTVSPSWRTSPRPPNEVSASWRPAVFVLSCLVLWAETVRPGLRSRILLSRDSTPRSTLRCLRPRSRKCLTLSSPNLRYQPRPTLAFINDTL